MKKIAVLASIVLMFAVSTVAQPRQMSRNHRPVRNYAVSRTHSRTPRALGVERNTLRLHIMGELGISDICSVFYHNGISHFGAGAMLEWQPACVFSMGIGANFDAGSNVSRPYFCDFMYSVPIYANFKLSTPGFFRFFVEGRIGGALPVYITNTDFCAMGLYTGGGIGMAIGGSHISVGVNVTDLYRNSICQAGERCTRHFGYNSHVLAEFYLRYSYAIRLR